MAGELVAAGICGCRGRRLSLGCGCGADASTDRAADQGARQDPQWCHGTDQGTRAGADAAACHGALAPGVAAGGDTEENGSENEYLGHDEKLPFAFTDGGSTHRNGETLPVDIGLQGLEMMWR